MNKTLLILAAAATCVLSPRVFAQDAPLPGTLFFQYTANTGSGHERIPNKNFASQIVRLSPSNGPKMVGVDCYGVTFDPNTNRMCFARGRDFFKDDEKSNHNVFYVCNLDGSNVHLLKRERIDYSGYSDVPDDFMPAYTPDGHILFETGDRVARMNGDGGNVVYLTGENERCGMPYQVGDRIIFDKDGVCMMNADGTNRTRIASYPTYYGAEQDDNDDYTDGQLSPDGNFVAFARDNEIFVADVNNPRNAHRLSPTEGRFKAMEFSDPVWSPDGRFLAIGGGDDDAHDIYVIDMESETVRQLTNTPDKDELPCDWDEVRE